MVLLLAFACKLAQVSQTEVDGFNTHEPFSHDVSRR